MKILGLDVGEKRIGIARADSSTRIAIPIGFIEVNGTEWQELDRIAKLNNTNFFVIGLPRSNEGNETKQSEYVRNFARVLTKKIPEARIRFQDESLTSVVAEERLKSRRKVYGKGEIDAEAASIILQDFLESFKSNTKAPESSAEGIGATTGAIIASEPRNDGRERSVPEGDDSGDLQVMKDLAKKEADKVKLNTKKAKHKMKTVTKAISGVVILLVIATLAIGGFLIYKQHKDEERARYFAEQEAKMNAESVFEFTIRPGETIFEIKDALAEAGYNATEIDEAFSAKYDFDFLKERPEGATLEGYLYGETFQFYKDTPVKEILEKYLEKMGEVIKENNLEAKFAERGMSLFQGVTLASVVQSEAGNMDDDMPNVASVFYNRIANSIPLGSDVTVSYALDTIDPNREEHQDNQEALLVESCYNTRQNLGLPCGPISNPGLNALLAAAEPADTAYFYFLTGDDGLMYYSYTEAEHNQNVYDHCQNLCNVSL